MSIVQIVICPFCRSELEIDSAGTPPKEVECGQCRRRFATKDQGRLDPSASNSQPEFRLAANQFLQLRSLLIAILGVTMMIPRAFFDAFELGPGDWAVPGNIGIGLMLFGVISFGVFVIRDWARD